MGTKRAVSYTVSGSGFSLPRPTRVVRFRASVQAPDASSPPVLERPTMLPIRHLLYLAPDEGLSAAAWRTSLHLARTAGATLHVPVGDGSPEALRAETSAEERPALRVADLPSSPGPRVAAVQQYVDEETIDLVVTDTPRDRGPIPPLAAPRTQSLLRRLACSVLVAEHARPLRDLRRLLVPTDLTAPSTTAFEYAAALAAYGDAAIDLFHVIDTDPYVALTRTDRLSLSETSVPEWRARRRLTSFLDTHSDPDVPVESHFAYGEPADRIGRFVNRHEVDLMVLSAQSGPSGTHSSLGSVADRVLRRVTCPVLLVRPPYSDDPDAPSV